MIDERELADVLSRVIRRVCPFWMASQREDLVQTACLRIVRKWKDVEGNHSLEASYVWRVAHSVVMDEIRRRRRRPEVTMDNPGVAEQVSLAASPEGRRSAAELREAIHEGIKRLSETRQWAVQLYLQGFSLKESARILGWNEKRVDNQRYQGLAELRIHLEKQGFKP